MPLPGWLKAPKLPTIEPTDGKQVDNRTGFTNYASTGIIGGAPELAGPPSSAELELWRRQRAEKVARGEDPGKCLKVA